MNGTSDNDVALFAILVIFGFPMVAWVVFRLLKHRERIEMIRHGFNPSGENEWRDWMRENSGMTQRMPPPAQMSRVTGFDPSAQALLRRGITVAAIGFALTIGLSFIGYRGDGVIVPGAWLLGGLIPLFIGLAQVLSAMMSGAVIVRPAQQLPPRDVNAAAPPPFPERTPTTTYEGSYTYRPGAQQELRPPNPPPTQSDK